MTPMIDILLVLLIIFLVITPLKPVGLPSQVPADPSQAPPSPPDPGIIVIRAKGGDVVEVNRSPVPIAELPAKLLAVYHARPDHPVFIDGDPGLEFREVARVIDIVRGVGLTRTGLMPGNREVARAR